MRGIHRERPDSDSTDRSVDADVLLRREPDDDEDDQEDNGGGKSSDEDEGYSE